MVASSETSNDWSTYYVEYTLRAARKVKEGILEYLPQSRGKKIVVKIVCMQHRSWEVE